MTEGGLELILFEFGMYIYSVNGSWMCTVWLAEGAVETKADMEFDLLVEEGQANQSTLEIISWEMSTMYSGPGSGSALRCTVNYPSSTGQTFLYSWQLTFLPLDLSLF